MAGRLRFRAFCLIGIDRERQENGAATQTYNSHYQLNHPRQIQAGHAGLIEAVGFRMASWIWKNGFALLRRGALAPCFVLRCIRADSK